jgi:hypothetical protein
VLAILIVDAGNDDSDRFAFSRAERSIQLSALRRIVAVI